jgi:hypothetical protein
LINQQKCEYLLLILEYYLQIKPFTIWIWISLLTWMNFTTKSFDSLYLSFTVSHIRFWKWNQSSQSSTTFDTFHRWLSVECWKRYFMDVKTKENDWQFNNSTSFLSVNDSKIALEIFFARLDSANLTLNIFLSQNTHPLSGHWEIFWVAKHNHIWTLTTYLLSTKIYWNKLQGKAIVRYVPFVYVRIWIQMKKSIISFQNYMYAQNTQILSLNSHSSSSYFHIIILSYAAFVVVYLVNRKCDWGLTFMNIFDR